MIDGELDPGKYDFDFDLKEPACSISFCLLSCRSMPSRYCGDIFAKRLTRGVEYNEGEGHPLLRSQ